MRTLISVLLLAGMATSGVYAQEDNNHDVESRIIVLERLWKLQAYKARDLKTLDQIFDDAFVAVDQGGKLTTKAEMLRFVRTVDSLEYLTDAMVVNVHGDTAIVTGLYQMKGVAGGKPILRRGRFVDTWLYKNEQWVAMASVSVPDE